MVIHQLSNPLTIAQNFLNHYHHQQQYHVHDYQGSHIIMITRDFTRTNIEALRVQQLFCSPPGSQDCEDLLEVV